MLRIRRSVRWSDVEMGKLARFSLYASKDAVAGLHQAANFPATPCVRSSRDLPCLVGPIMCTGDELQSMLDRFILRRFVLLYESWELFRDD